MVSSCMLKRNRCEQISGLINQVAIELSMNIPYSATGRRDLTYPRISVDLAPIQHSNRVIGESTMSDA